MCKFFSFNVDKSGKVYFLGGIRGCRYNLDSHSLISERCGLNDDEVWKFEINCDEYEDYDLKKWRDHELSESDMSEIMGRLKYDGGLPEEKLKNSVLKRIKEQLKDILPKLYSFTKFSLTFPEVNETKIYEFEEEISQEVVEKYLESLLAVNKGKYFKKKCYDGTTMTFYVRINKPSKKLLAYSYLHEYAKLDEGGNPVKIFENRVVIKNIDSEEVEDDFKRV